MVGGPFSRILRCGCRNKNKTTGLNPFARSMTLREIGGGKNNCYSHNRPDHRVKVISQIKTLWGERGAYYPKP